ncbi:hypothetical protein DKX38_021105 [Salix brachista]|uniref:Uncharacterized protein n=1 Tax=Salix brachista TaxID=2182728 RepID=A0A5N5K748_9ROSI|nr:hypothetical protein DKX38_021105 [Salix brachista]
MDYVGFTKRYIETAYFATSRSELLYDPLLGSRECSDAKYAATFTAERHGATSNGNQDVTIPILVGNISTGCLHDFSPLYYTQSSAAWSPKLSGQQQSPYPLGNSIHSNPDVHDSKKNHSNLCHLGFYLTGASLPLALLTALLSTAVTYGCLIHITHVSQLRMLNCPGKIPELVVHGLWLGRKSLGFLGMDVDWWISDEALAMKRGNT